ncbi:spliceosome-associated protein CWC27 homolog, partial [Saccostrea cucullata]|uniref:spliceosome-associated protein CWC27 homolog n=1 Tax=Saccostrea cuccullata TaxID=36930 RepID=UPI002ED4759E
ITGNTQYNLGKLQEVEVDQHDRPYDPHKIKTTHILSNPFDDIIPRVSAHERKSKETKEDKVKSKSKATKNYKLLSFGDEAEEQEEEVDLVSKDSKGKSKSSHDLIDDPSLSTETTEIDQEEVRQRLAQPPKEKKRKSPSPDKDQKEEQERISKTEELRQEAKRLKRDLREMKTEKKQSEEDKVKEEPEEKNEVIAAYKAEREKYKKAKVKKGSGREEATLALLAKFQSKLDSVKRISGDYSDEEEAPEGETETAEAPGDMSWMTHKLIFEDEERKKKVIDANIQELDRYEIYDPRNPLTKRRRENSKQTMKEKKYKT